MIRSRWLSIGLITGLILSFATSGLADNYKYVRAVLDNSVILSFDGEENDAEDINILIYEDRIYLPLRYLSEQLGADIEWDGEMRKVEVKTNRHNNQQDSETEDDGTIEEEHKNSETIDEQLERPINEQIYLPLPITKYASQAMIQVRDISVSDGITVVSLEINNQGEAPIQLDQQSTKLVIDNKEYRFEDIDSTVLFKYDSTWFNDIHEEEKREGIIRLPKIPTEATYAELHLKVLQNDGSGKEHHLVYYIKLN